VFLKGPHDDELTWPLKEKFEVKLLNQISDCEHHLDTMSYDDTAGRVTDGQKSCRWGNCKLNFNENFCRSLVPTCLYLKDNYFFLQIEYNWVKNDHSSSCRYNHVNKICYMIIEELFTCMHL